MEDTSKHLTYFRVENFKRFESFEMKNLGQFNLIVGDNNVGKTSVLEALLPSEEGWILTNRLFAALYFRKLKDNLKNSDLEFYLNKEYAAQNSSILAINFFFKFLTSPQEDTSIVFDRSSLKISVSGLHSSSNPSTYRYYDQAGINPNLNIPFIPFYKGHDNDLTTFYSKLQSNKSMKVNFIRSLNTIVPDLENIELSSQYQDSRPFLIVYQKHSDNTLPLALFGDGTVKLFRLLAEIVLNRGNRLMIDEIDAGIYFKRFKDFWKVILQTAKENDVQLFMTTHNEECIKYFKEVLEFDLPEFQKDVRNITLIENTKTKQVTAHTYDFEQFGNAINVGNEVRA